MSCWYLLSLTSKGKVSVGVDCRLEEENIKQAMQDANLREQAEANRDRIRQVPICLPALCLLCLASFCNLYPGLVLIAQLAALPSCFDKCNAATCAFC